MSIILAFDRICRACLSSSETFHDLFSVCSAEVFEFCTSVEVSEGDELPRMICNVCLDLLNKLCQFKQVAIKSNQILRGHAPLIQIQQDCDSIDGIANDDINTVLDADFLSTDMLNEVIILAEDELVGDKQFEPGGEDLQNVKAIEATKTSEVQNKCDMETDKIQISKPEETTDSNKKEKKPKTSKGMLKCVRCDKSFHKYDNLEAHMRTHFGKLPDIKCEQCGKAFTSQANLRSHSRVHTKIKRYQCGSCGERFAYLNVLKNHEMRHSGERPYACQLCEKRFHTRYNLQKHEMTHRGERKHPCQYCGKRFTQAGNLQSHLLRHSGVKAFACQVCDMRFTIQSDLKKHQMTHTSERPFKCESCSKSFKSRTLLNVHTRSHTDDRPYPCSECPKRFLTGRDLRSHALTHSGQRPHQCAHCQRAFTQRGALNRHTRIHMADRVIVEYVQ